jgi:hypothetical protein
MELVSGPESHYERLSGTMAEVQAGAKKLPTDVVVVYPRMFCRATRLDTCLWPRFKHFNNNFGSGSIRLDISIPAVSQTAQAVELSEMS